MDNTIQQDSNGSNYCSAMASHRRIHKYNSPFNTYDLQNLLQVRTFTRKWIRQVGTGEPPGVCILYLTANQSYQHLSDNAFIIKFHICISIWKGNEHWRRKIRAEGTTVITVPVIRQPVGLRGSVTQRWGQAHTKRGIIDQLRLSGRKMLSFRKKENWGG